MQTLAQRPLTSSRFQASLRDPTAFATLVELVPWAGPLADGRAERHLAIGRALAADPRVSALTITDNAGGRVRMSPVTLARSLQQVGAGVMIHVSCRDRSRAALASLAWDMASNGITDVLALSGDYPTDGYRGLSRPVFDIDSVALLAMLRELPLADAEDFFAGGVVNPFKSVERDLVPQLLKLAMKVRAGARFVITQVGWDARSWHELLRWMAGQGIDVPAIASVYILGRRVAEAFHRGDVPGCVLGDELMTWVERGAAAPGGELPLWPVPALPRSSRRL